MNTQIPNSIESNEATEGDNYAEIHLRGAAVGGAEKMEAVDHSEYEKSRNPDSELRLDGEDDSLYSDGLDIRGGYFGGHRG